MKTYHVVVTIYGLIKAENEKEAEQLLSTLAKEFGHSKGIMIDDYVVYVTEPSKRQKLSIDFE